MFDIVQGVVYLGAVLTRDQLLYVCYLVHFHDFHRGSKWETGAKWASPVSCFLRGGPFHQVRSVVNNCAVRVSPGLLLQFWCYFVAHVRLVNSCCRGILFASCDFLGKTFHNLVSAE